MVFLESHRRDQRGGRQERCSVRVKIGDYFVGTLTISDPDSTPTITLPKRGSVAAEIKIFLDALMQIAEADQNMREEPREYQT